ncbi:MAG TPA: MFS transporter [Acidimicrobiia bacterium]|nr:MFS transporter [Acidimicrobiia bacterium]
MKNDRRTIFGWAMYDWANSAYSTVIAGAVLPAYFVSEVAGENGWNGRSGESLFALTLALGTLLLFLAMPVLGAIADFSAAKKRFLRVFAYGGSLFTASLFLATSGNVLATLGLFLLAQVGFVGANVFYDGFLPDISTPDTIDRVSSRGFALGYIGGGLWLGVVIAMIQFSDDGALAARIGIGTTGLWWAGFTRFALSRLDETGSATALPDSVSVPRSWVRGIRFLSVAIAGGVITLLWLLLTGADEFVFNAVLLAWMAGLIFSVYRIATSRSAATVSLTGQYTRIAGIGFARMFDTAAKLRNFPHLLLFILAYMLYNDGVQTTINVSAAYAAGTLQLDTTVIAVTFLVVQFVAFGGALLFGWLSSRLHIKRAIQANLVVWIIVAVLAYRLPVGEAVPFLSLGIVIGFVLGGIQALSRSLYGSMIPEEASAEFYGFYSVFSKFSAIWGPLIFGIVSGSGESSRMAILSVVVFFVLGLIVFSRVDVEAARRSKADWSLDPR